jgi:hypothetical protein
MHAVTNLEAFSRDGQRRKSLTVLQQGPYGGNIFA